MADLELSRELRRMLQGIAEDGPIAEDRVLRSVRAKRPERAARLAQLLKAGYVRRVGSDIEICRAGLTALDASKGKP